MTILPPATSTRFTIALIAGTSSSPVGSVAPGPCTTYTSFAAEVIISSSFPIYSPDVSYTSRPTELVKII